MKKVWASGIILLFIFCSSCAKEQAPEAIHKVTPQITPQTTPKSSEITQKIAQNTENPIDSTIVAQGEIKASEVGILKLVQGVYSEGEKILTKEKNTYYWYEADGKTYIETEKVEINENKGDVLVISPTSQEEYGQMIHLTTTKDLNFTKVVNILHDRAIIQSMSSDATKHYNFEADLQSGEAVEITYTDKLSDDERKSSRKETVIALTEDTTLCHYYIAGKTAEDSYSIWLVIDKDNTVIKRFTTKYFDDMDNICVSEDKNYVCFTYQQTTRSPHILNIEKELVYPIFDEKDFYGYESVLFMNWVNEDTLALGYKKNDEQIIKFHKVTFD